MKIFSISLALVLFAAVACSSEDIATEDSLRATQEGLATLSVEVTNLKTKIAELETTIAEFQGTIIAQNDQPKSSDGY
jgi:septal ring factor EnvC (AmiA/AmiB activator)